MRKIGLSALFVATLIISGLSTLTMAQSNWFDTNWGYRRPVAISNPSGVQISEYQVEVRLDSSFDFSKAKNDGSDLRVTNTDGETLIPFWIETWNPAQSIASIWARVPSLPPGGTTIYLYYGNSTASSVSNGEATFDAYDGFESYIVGYPPGAGMTNPGEWSRYSGNPLITEGPPGAWDDHGATFASVIWDDRTNEFRMFYHGFSFSGVHQIGLASSTDGLHWTKSSRNPILTPTPGAWDSQQVRVPMVWKEGINDYRMIYTGVGGGVTQAGYAYSSDGVNWTKYPTPVFNDPNWAHDQTENWGVIKVGSQYLMWYSNLGAPRESGIAVSTDLIHWTPYQPDPIFKSSGNPSDDRYSQFCPFSFKYGNYYYVLVPSYDSGSNYSEYYLYRSSSPYFPESDRHLVRVSHMVGASGQWDSHDNDTPFVLTLDIQRSVFYNNQLWVYYAAEGGTDLWKEGLLIEQDIARALSDASLPGSQLDWTAAGDVTVVGSPVRQGARSVRQNDISTSDNTQLRGYFEQMNRGVVSAWMRRNSTSLGDYELYLYGGSTLACIAGLGRNGRFWYWDGTYHDTSVSWSTDTWYLINVAFDATTYRYDFFVYNETLTKLVSIKGISFDNSSSFVDSAMLYTSLGYTGQGYGDDFRVRKSVGTEPAVSVAPEEQNELLPTISSLNPASATAGGPGFTLYVNGTNFIPTSIVRWNGSDRPTTFVSSQQLTAQIPSSDIALPGAAAVSVFNPGGGASNSVTFIINAPNPVPTITSISPDVAKAGGPGFTLFVNGTNFIPSSIVRWNGSDRTTTVVSNQQLTAEITSADITLPGTATVTVFNPAPGGGTSNTINFCLCNCQ